MKQRTLDNTARIFRLEGDSLCARLGPLPFGSALQGIARQSELAVPAKFTLSHSGEAEIQAEIPLIAKRQVCEKLADAALDAALLLPSLKSDPREPDRMAFTDSEIQSALSKIPWGYRQQDTGVFQIDAAPAPEHAMRVTLVAQGAALRASTTTSLRADSPEVCLALAYFAMESNRRLRLSRIGVAAENGKAHIVWDGIIDATLPAAGGIAPIVEAVVYAQTITRRPLSLLTEPRIAEAYLRHGPVAKHNGVPRPTKRSRGRKPSRKRSVSVAVTSDNRAGQSIHVEQFP